MVRSLFYIACYFVSLHSQASVTEKYPEASYEMMSGACVVTISRMRLSLIRGYVINPKGYVLGRLERLSDFHFIFHKQVETEINNQTIYSRGCPEFCVNGASVNSSASFPQIEW